MSNNNDIELSNSDDCEKYINQFIQEVPLRRAEIGQGTVIKRALPSRHKRMIGAWCFLDTLSPVKVHTELLGVDLFAAESTRARLSLDPRFEYGFMALEGLASINGHELTEDNMVILEPGLQHVDIEIHAGGRVLLIGGEPFESPILLWWNLVGRDVEELKLAREQWMMGHPRFGTIPSYDGPRMEAPAFPEHMRASK